MLPTGNVRIEVPDGETSVADIVVSGAGAAGLTAAIALARSGFSVVCAGKSDVRPTGRTVALFEGSLRFLRAVGLWQQFEDEAQPIRSIRLIDDTGLRVPVPSLTLDAGEIDLEALGANVQNDKLVSGLLAIARSTANLTLTDAILTRFSIGEHGAVVIDEKDRRFAAPLLIAADGRKSPARAAAGIGARAWSYQQVAMSGFLHHTKPHGNRSVEFHTRNGPCTLVPLAGTSEHSNRSSLVWLMSPVDADRRKTLSDDALAAELQVHVKSIFGSIEFEPPRGFFPMGGLRVNRLVAPGIVLIGEAAHAFPPLAAQGLNLSLRDIAQLMATLAAGRRRSVELGSLAVLTPYERARRRDIAVRTNSVDVLNRSIMTDFAPVDAARGMGALALRIIGPLRRAVLREGILAPLAEDTIKIGTAA